MADDKDTAKADAQEAKTVKRRLRTGSETVRERTAKYQKQQQDTQPSGRSIFSAFIYGFSWPLRQIGHLLAKLGRFWIFRILRRPARILGLILFPKYFRDSWRELRMVTWPSRRQSWKLTYAVIVFSVIFGALVAIVDFGLDKLFKEFIIK